MTQPTVAPADALAAEGVTIELDQPVGAVQLRYTFGSLRLLEARFTSLQAMADQVQTAAYGRACAEHRGEDGTGDPAEGCSSCTQPGAIFSVLADAITPGLLHVRTEHPDSGARVRLGRDVELVAELMDPARTQHYLAAWQAAFLQAMADMAGRGNAGAQGAPEGSPGPSGTTPPPSPSGAPTASSGA